MNRAERRRLGITKPPVTINLKLNEYDDLKLKIQKEVRSETTYFLTACMAMALNNQFGFGTKRINDLMDRVYLQLECILDENTGLTGTNIFEWCKENKIKLMGGAKYEQKVR